MGEEINNKELGFYTLKTVIFIIGIWILKLIIISLPFIKEMSIPGLFFPASRLINTLFILLIVFFLIKFGVEIRKIWKLDYPKYAKVGIIISMLVFLIALIILYGVTKEYIYQFSTTSEPLLALQIVSLIITVLLLFIPAKIIYQSLPKWLETLKDRISQSND